MDKETLSNYGWIVICVLVLAVMLALASPFGNFIADAIKSTTQGLFDTNQKALQSANINIMQQEFETMLNGSTENSDYSHSEIIPDGATYTKADGTVLNPGETFPDVMTAGDIYTYGDYRYGYCAMYNPYAGWQVIDENANCWGVVVQNQEQEVYGQMLDSINNKPVSILFYTYAGCSNLLSSPKISNNTILLMGTFIACTSLTEAPVIPSNTLSMGEAFYGCTSLTTAPIIPNGVTDIDSAFESCENLKTYVGSTDPDGDFSGYIIPDGVTSLIETFASCKSITVAPKVPNTVTDMQYTFTGCTSLIVAPTIPNGVTTMVDTFTSCKNLKTYHGSNDTDGDFSNYVIPSTVTSMANTFNGCLSLTVTPQIPNAVTNMNSTFNGCESLTIAPVIPNSVTSMGNTFKDCKSLKTYVGNIGAEGDFSNFVIPSNVTDIQYLFSGCEKIIIAPEIPSSVKSMYGTFRNCTSLATAPVIPSNVTGMWGLFQNCTSLTGTVTINATPSNCEKCFDGVDMTNITLTGSASKDVLNLIGATGKNWTPIE